MNYNRNFYTPPIRPDELYHHGILGMKWGIRRYQPYPKGYSGDGKEVGKAKRVKQKVKDFAKATNYEKKEVGRLRTGVEAIGRAALISALSGVGGLAIGMTTYNPVLAVQGQAAIAAALTFSPIGKTNIYFKKDKPRD